MQTLTVNLETAPIRFTSAMGFCPKPGIFFSAQGCKERLRSSPILQ